VSFYGPDMMLDHDGEHLPKCRRTHADQNMSTISRREERLYNMLRRVEDGTMILLPSGGGFLIKGCVTGAKPLLSEAFTIVGL
jgi:hypothetical protein